MTQQDLINAATYLIHHWPQIIKVSVLGLSISMVLQYLKRRFKLDQAEVRIMRFIRVDGPRIVVLLQTALVSLGTFYMWLLDPNNAQYIPERFGFLLAATFYIHRFLVSPLGTRLEKSLQPYLAALEQVKKEAVPTVIPPTIPVNPMTPTQQAQPTLNPQQTPPELK